jgi:arylsulfatase A-like enzyme
MFSAKYPLRMVYEATSAGIEALATLKNPKPFLLSAFQQLTGISLISKVREHGLTTVAFTDAGWVNKGLGFAEGFDLFDDKGGHLKRILPRVKGWLNRHRDRPFFLFIHAYDTHSPYSSQEPFDSRFCKDHSGHIDLRHKRNRVLMQASLTQADHKAINDHYDGGIASADAYIGRLLDKLRKLKLYDESLIIVTSDHGESLGEHNRIGHGSLYLEQLLVPLIIKLPKALGISPRVIDEPVALVDVMPTILDLLGAELPDKIDGRSLMPVIRKDDKGREHLLAQVTFEMAGQQRVKPTERAILRPGRWLLIHDARDTSFEIFDLKSDPRGLVDLSAKKPDALGELKRALSVHDPHGPVGSMKRMPLRPLSNRVKQQLEALGYTGD